MSKLETEKSHVVSARATWATVDLSRIAGNTRVFRQLVGPGVKVMAVVKANGYGHGTVMIARTAIKAGADYLAVATVDEGVQLRDHGITAPVLVLGPERPDELLTAIENRLDLAVGSTEEIGAISRAALLMSGVEPVNLHLKIDTGMRRFGCLPEQAPDLAAGIAAAPNLQLTGTFTHFASADESDEAPTLEQAARFDEVLVNLRALSIDAGIRHAANSAATLRSRRYDYDMVRVGISLYGIAPSPDITLPNGIKPAMSIRSRVGRVFELARGDRVSYGGTYEATKPERAALIPIGYADGYRRGLSNKAWVGISGARCPVRGRVCMDQTVVGLPDHVKVEVGDEVAVAGDSDLGAPTFDELAEMTGTIGYEIATGIARRVPRVFLESDEVIAVEDLHGLHEAVQKNRPPVFSGADERC